MKMAQWRIAAISLAATGMAATAAPAAALPLNITADVQSRTGVEGSQNSDRGRHDGWERGRGAAIIAKAAATTENPSIPIRVSGADATDVIIAGRIMAPRAC